MIPNQAQRLSTVIGEDDVKRGERGHAITRKVGAYKRHLLVYLLGLVSMVVHTAGMQEQDGEILLL